MLTNRPVKVMIHSSNISRYSKPRGYSLVASSGKLGNMITNVTVAIETGIRVPANPMIIDDKITSGIIKLRINAELRLVIFWKAVKLMIEAMTAMPNKIGLLGIKQLKFLMH